MSEEEKQHSLTSRTISGAVWSGGGRIATQLISTGSTIVLAHLLTPKAYGLVGMARLATGLIEIFRDLGMTSAIIQRKELSDALLSTIFWATVIMGLLTAALSIAVSPLVALFFHEPQTGPILRVLSLGFVISCVGAVPGSVLGREMSFRRIMSIDLISTIAGTAVAIAMAFSGWGAWSLVISSLAGAGVGTILYWLSCRWRPRWYLNWRELRTISSYSLNLTGFNFLNFFSRSADNAIVGRYLGASQLGLYQQAYSLMLYAIQNVSWVLGRVLFPAFAKLQHDNERFRAAYIRSVSMIAVVTFPLMAGLMGVADPFVRALLGPKWIPVIPLLTILAPVGMIQSVVTTVGNIYNAKGRTDWLLRWGIASTVLTVGSFMAGIPWGVKGVAFAYLIVNLLLLYPVFAIPFRLIELRMSEFLRALLPVLGASVAMLAGISALGAVLPGGNPVARLSFLVPAGFLMYGAILFLFRPEAAVALFSVLRGLRSSKGLAAAALQRR